MKWIQKLFGFQAAEPSREPTETRRSTGPETAKEHYQLGWKFHEKNKLDEAAEEYRKALLLDPSFALVRSNLGMVYRQQGKMDDAIREWEETLNRGVRNAVVRMNTQDWLKDAKALRDERLKPISDVDGALKSYLEELGQASGRWHVAYEAITRLGTPAIAPLVQALESENDLLRSRAIDLLGKMGDKSAIPALEKASKLGEQDFRRITGLSGKSRIVNMGGTQIEVPVSGLLDDYHRYAKETLKQIKKRV
jgi:tetratricopeptide (TPR) repeat protein